MTDFWYIARPFGILCLIILFSMGIKVEILLAAPDVKTPETRLATQENISTLYAAS